jgi:hypothetical protein
VSSAKELELGTLQGIYKVREHTRVTVVLHLRITVELPWCYRGVSSAKEFDLLTLQGIRKVFGQNTISVNL